METLFKHCTIDDLEILRDFSESMYSETFKDMCSPEDMQAYLRAAFAVEKIRTEPLNPCSDFYMLKMNGTLCGYIKINEADAQSDLHDPESLELERIYVSKECQGKGLGAYLLELVIDIARNKGKKYIWLGVWEKNARAIGFYQKHGFYEIGTHTFVMGDDAQTDYILKKLCSL